MCPLHPSSIYHFLVEADGASSVDLEGNCGANYFGRVKFQYAL
jgi:hypothetical protein